MAGGVRRAGWVVLAGLLSALTGCAEPAAPRAAPASRPACAPSASPARPGAGGNPLGRLPFFVDPAGPAVLQAARWEGQGRAADAATLRRIADRPVALWLAGGAPDGVTARVDELVACAAALGRLPILVAYNIPHRDCGNFSSGGAASPEDYKAWIRAFAAGLRGRPAAVVLEPDAVPHAVEGCDTTARYALLADAVGVLKAAGAAVYVDAGNPHWITDVRRLAAALRAAGVERADGFALNVANFVTTPDNLAFGRQVSDAIPARPHFVIDTSRNGAGPIETPGDVDGAPRWCNPPGRVLGPPPTADTGDPRVDALLWIKRPGESDGACRPNEPPAGQWWPEYALDLAARSG